MLALLLFLFLITFIGHVSSQEQIGLRTENYAGVNSMLLNPANNLTGKFVWDVNLASAAVFFDNRYAFVRNTNVSDFINRSDDLTLITDFDNESQIGPNDLVLDFFGGESKKNSFLDVKIMGPSFMVKTNGGHTFGLFTNFRTSFSTPNLPFQTSYPYLRDRSINEDFAMPTFSFAGMAWAEYGLNYGISFPTSTGTIGFGTNIKLLQGYEGFYFRNNQAVTVTQLPGDTVDFSGAFIDFGFTNSNVDQDEFNLNKGGFGVGMDIGAVITWDGYGEDEYKFKLGVSILDIGKINFNRDAQVRSYQIGNMISVPSQEFDSANSVDEFFEITDEILLGQGNSSLAAGNFGLWLPTALSVQADYAVTQNFYVNGLVVQPLPFSKLMVQRPSTFAVSPRFEHRWFSASLPLVVHNWQDFRIGTSVRLAFITLGTDNLTSIISKGNFTGSDIYVAVKVNPFNLNFGGGNSNGWDKGGKKTKCYQF